MKSNRCIQTGWIRNRKSPVALSALALQVVILLLPAGFGYGQLLHHIGIAGLIASVQITSSNCKSRYWTVLDTAMAMTLVGALGMTLGGLIDSWGNAPGRCTCCQAGSVFTWSNGLMLISCFFGCHVLFPHDENRSAVRWCGDCVCMTGMTAGMLLAKIFLMPRMTHIDGGSIDVHWVMLLGMFFGDVAGLIACALLSRDFVPAGPHKADRPLEQHCQHAQPRLKRVHFS